MKHVINYLLSVLVGALFLATVHNCRPENVVESTEPNHSNECRLVARTISYSLYSQRINWIYSLNNVLVQYSNPQAVGEYPSKVDCKYNTDGYLIAMTQIRVYSGFAGFFTDTVITTYEYVNGKLVRENSGTKLFSYAGTINYEYNQSGELTKVVDRTDPFGDIKTSEFSSGKLTDYIVIYDGSNIEVRPYELNNGRIIREYAQDRQYYTNYQYDEQDRPTKIERVDGSRITEYYTYEYTAGKAYFQAIPLPKGWPAMSHKTFVYESLLVNSPVMPVGLPVRWIRYSTTRPGSNELFKNIVKEYTYVKNNQSYPVRSEYTTTVYTSFGGTVGTPASVSEVYIYEGCL